VLAGDQRIVDAELTLRASSDDELTLWDFQIVTEVSKADQDASFYPCTGSGVWTNSHECAALLDACYRVKLIPEADHRMGKELLFRLVSMLVKLTQSFDT
jgi:hypothetical protein